MKKSFIVLFALLLSGTVFSQNDRPTFGLKGNVSEVSPNKGEHSIYSIGRNDWFTYDLSFSSTGNLEKVNGLYVTSDNFAYEYDIQRDSKNRISKLSNVAGDGVQWVIFHYDNKGRVSSEEYVYENYDAGESENIGNVKYTYDNDNNVIKAVVYDAWDSTTNTVDYTYTKFDKDGNWTARTANCTDMGLNNKKEMRTLAYHAASEKSGTVVSNKDLKSSKQAVSNGTSATPKAKKRSFWDILFEILLGAALLFMISYMVYILLIRDRNLVAKTVEDFQQYRQAAALPAESSDSENNLVDQLFHSSYQNLTPFIDGQGEQNETFTTKKQIEQLRSAIVQVQETAPTDPDRVEKYNIMIRDYKRFTKREFTGSKTYLIVGGIVTILMVFPAGIQSIPFMLLNILGYYFASRETLFMMTARDFRGTSSRSSSRSKVMTAITMAAIGVFFSGQTYKTVTTWSDGSTTTDYDNDEHLYAFIIGIIILTFLAFFMFVVAMINFIRNYLIYR